MINTIKLLISITFLIFMLSSCNQRTIKEEKYPNGKVKSSYEEIKNNESKIVRDGFYKEFYPSGEIKLEGFYRMDKKDSLWVSFSQTGKRKYELNFKNGLANGKYKIWNDEGFLVGETEFVNGNNTMLEGSWLMKTIVQDDYFNFDIGFLWQFEKFNILNRKYESDPDEAFVGCKFEFSDLSNDSNISGIKIIGDSPDNQFGYEPFTYKILLMSKDEILMKNQTKEGYIRLNKANDYNMNYISDNSNINNLNISKTNELWYYYKNAKTYVAGSLCYKKDTTNCDKYGRLYNWQQAQKACSGAWRLPTSYELVALLSKYGDIAYDGNHETMKELFGDYMRSKNDETYNKMMNDKTLNLPNLIFNESKEEENLRTLFWTSNNTLYGAYAVSWIGNNEGKGNIYFSAYPREFYGFCRCVRK